MPGTQDACHPASQFKAQMHRIVAVSVCSYFAEGPELFVMILHSGTMHCVLELPVHDHQCGSMVMAGWQSVAHAVGCICRGVLRTHLKNCTQHTVLHSRFCWLVVAVSCCVVYTVSGNLAVHGVCRWGSVTLLRMTLDTNRVWGVSCRLRAAARAAAQLRAELGKASSAQFAVHCTVSAHDQL